MARSILVLFPLPGVYLLLYPIYFELSVGYEAVFTN